MPTTVFILREVEEKVESSLDKDLFPRAGIDRGERKRDLLVRFGSLRLRKRGERQQQHGQTREAQQQ
jgi:hypothetical protein